MSSSQSDDSSDEFFDAEDTTPHRIHQKKKSPKNVNESGFIFPKNIDTKELQKHKLKNEEIENPIKILDHQKNRDIQSYNLKKSSSSTSADDFVEPKTSDRQRFRELRQTMQNDEDENVGNTLTPDSQNSSVEGVYPGQRTSHPFRILEQDTASIQSMTSLGRVGRILAGSLDPSSQSVGRDSINVLTKSNSQQQMQNTLIQLQEKDTMITSETQSTKSSGSTNNDSVEPYPSTMPRMEENQITLAEPDVIASTKLASKLPENSQISRPVVPPRRRKNQKKLSNTSSEKIKISETIGLPMNEKDIIDNDKNDEENEILNEKNVQHKMKTAASAIESFQRELDKSFAISGLDNKSGSVKNRTIKSASLNRIYTSLGNSNTSINSRPSPSNSAKSNSAPSRVSSIDTNQGLNLHKTTRGKTVVVQPQDKEDNKAVGPSLEELERINTELFGPSSRDRSVLAGTGTNSLGSGSRYEPLSSIRFKNSKERRKSAGDEDLMKQLNLYVRTRTDSGKELTDIEILQQVPVKNLDTGEKFPLSKVDEKLPELKKEMNPLSVYIMRLTSEVPPEMDEETVDIPTEVVPADEEDGDFEEGSRLKRKTEKIRRFFGSTMRKTVDKAKSIASEVSHARHKEDVAEVDDVVNPEINIKIKASNTNKGPYEFTKLQHVQDLSGEHTSAVWCMKFSSCGRLLATAGQDKLLRIWVLKDAYPFFQDMRTKYNTDHQKSSPTPSQESLVSQSSSAEEAIAMATAAEKSLGPFMPKAFCTYSGHESDLLDVSWSKNYFILSSSMDKTVRLWHISRKECLCCFQHIDFVTAIAFHPRDDRYFLSGSLDGKFRLWNIPDKKVALWGEIDGETKLITAANFCANGKFAVIGSYDGRCIFYTTDKFKYHTQIHVRSTRGRNSTGRKISGIEPMPGEDKILVTSNDSRIRLYDLRDLNLSCKYKGYLNTSSQIKASFSHDGKYIISGSENQCIYIWKTHHDYAKLSSVRRDRNDFWEGIKAHNATVTCAIFAPHPEAIIKPDPDEMSSEEAQNYKPDPLVEQHKKGCGYVLVTADFSGAIKVFINKTKPKHSSLPYTAIMD